MIAVQERNTGITRDLTYKSGGTGGTPADALATSAKQQAINEWREAIDEMLGWKSSPEQFDVDDQPDEAILDTAIDYAMDQVGNAEGAPAPSSIVPSGNGRIAMEWNDGPETVTVEFIESGTAIYTRFYQGRVSEKAVLTRNPQTRKLELPG